MNNVHKWIEHMTYANTLLKHVLIYIGIWVLIFLGSDLGLFPDEKTVPGAIAISGVLTAIFFYPPIAIARVFQDQTGQKNWLHVLYGILGAALLFAGFCVTGALGGEFRGYGSLGYAFGGLLSGLTLSVTTIAAACIGRIQHNFTRLLGYATFACIGACLVFVGVDAFGLTNDSSIDTGKLITAGLSALSAIVGFGTSMFLGIKEKEG